MVIHSTSIFVQLLEGCKDYFITVEGRKGSYSAKGNTLQVEMAEKWSRNAATWS